MKTLPGMKSVVLIAGLALLPGVSWAQSVTTGAIAGVVKDTTGAVLPGVTVEAASPALIEKVRTSVSDANGNYKIIELRPGTYTVTFTLQGFNTLKREGLELTTGFTATANVDMKVGNLAETITVTGASPVVDIQNVRQQSVLSREAWDALPTGKNLMSFASITLGASIGAASQDVGGARGESGGTGHFTFHGAPIGDERMLIDGMNFSTIQAGGGPGMRVTYHNTLNVEETTIGTSGASAEAETGGVTINLVPRDGGNSFTGLFMANGSTPRLQNHNLTPALIGRGLLTAPGIKKLYDVGGSVGGPVRKDRLWFFAADRTWGAQNNVSGSWYNKTHGTVIYTPDLSRPGYTSAPHHNDSVRFTWQAAAKHKIAGSVELQTSCICFWTVDQAHSPEATVNIHSPYAGTRLYQTTWNYPATNRILFEAGNSSMIRHNPDSIRTAGVTTSDIPMLDLTTQFFWGAAAQNNGIFASNYTGTNPSHAINSNQRVSMSYVTGSHAFKTGLMMLEADAWGGGTGFNNTPYGPVRFEFRGGTNGVVPVPASITQFLSPTGPDPAVKDKAGSLVIISGFFGQDQWTLRRLTLNVGVRYDGLQGRVRPSTTVANNFTGRLSFPGRDHVPSWKDITPRLGMAFDLFGNGKTAVKASLGKYTNGGSTTLTGANSPAALGGTNATRTWADANADYVPNCDLKNPQANGECGRLSNVNVGQPVAPSTTYDPAYLVGFGVRGYLWQGAVNLQHELLPGMALNVGYFRTPSGRFTATDNRAVLPADYSPFCVTAPTDARLGAASGAQLCGLYDLNPAKFGQVDNFVTLAAPYGKQSNVYNGVEFSVNARFGKGGLLQGGVGFGQTVSNNCFTVDSPQAVRPGFCEVTLGWTQQTQVKFAGNYPLPWWGVQVSGTFQNLPGPTYGASRLYSSAEVTGSLGRSLSAGTVSVPLVVPNTLFEPRLTQLDLRLTKMLRIGKARVQGQFDVYNAFNGSPVTGLNGTYGPLWRTPTSILGARLVKFGGQFNF